MQMYENDPRTEPCGTAFRKGGGVKEGTEGSSPGGEAGIITADLRVMAVREGPACLRASLCKSRARARPWPPTWMCSCLTMG